MLILLLITNWHLHIGRQIDAIMTGGALCDPLVTLDVIGGRLRVGLSREHAGDMGWGMREETPGSLWG